MEEKYDINVFDEQELYLTRDEIIELASALGVDLELQRRGWYRSVDIELEEQRQQLSPVFKAPESRNDFIGGMRAILSCLFHEYDLPTRHGVDFASGSSGVMVEDILTPIIEKNTWLQSDVHPEAVRINQESHPDSHIMQGSFFSPENLVRNGEPLKRNSVPIVTVMNGLHCTQFLEEAIERMSGIIKTRGYLLHIFDLRGTRLSVVRYESVNDSKYGPGPGPVTAFTYDGGGRFTLYFYEMPDGRFLDVRDLFRKDIAGVINGIPNMELLLNDWICATKPVDDGEKGLIFDGGAVKEIDEPIRGNVLLATLARKIG